MPGRLGEHISEKRKHKQFGVPEGVAAIFFAGEQLGTHIDPVIMFVGGTHQVEYVQPNRTIKLRISLDIDVGLPPHLAINIGMNLEFTLEPFGNEVLDLTAGGGVQFVGRSVTSIEHCHVFGQHHAVAFIGTEVAEFNALLAKGMEHTIAQHIPISAGAFKMAADTHVQILITRGDLHIHPVLTERLIGGDNGVLDLETGRIIEVDDGAVGNLLHFD